MKKIIKRTLMVCFAFIVAMSAMLLATGLGERKLSPALALPDLQQESDDNESTLFFIDIDLVSGNGQDTLVYDKYDNVIKVLDNENNFKDQNPVVKTDLAGVSDILTSELFILLYDSESHQFQAFDNEYNSLEFNYEQLTAIENAKFIDLIKLNDKQYLFLSPQQTSDTFQLAELSLSENVLSITKVLNFSVQELYSAIASYDCVYLSQNNDNLLVMLINDSGILSFEISPDAADNYVVTTTTAVTGLSETESVNYIDNITLNEIDLIVAGTENSLSFYKLLKSPTLHLEKIENKQIDLDGQVLTDAFAKGDKLLLIFNSAQKLDKYTFTGTVDDFTFSAFPKTNPEVSISSLDAADFSYLNVTKDTILINSPYSRVKLIDIAENKNVAVIALASSDNTPIVGWHYVLYSDGDNNYYGFIQSAATSPLEGEVITPYSVKVLDFTVLRKYPSIIADGKNTDLMTINSSSNVQVIDELYGYTSLGTTYLHVVVDGIDGFIDAVRAKVIDNKTTKIVTNAKVTKNNSKIFAEADDESEVLAELNKGARVKIIGKRDTVKNLTHIAFNDQDGNEISGYIYTSNLQTDTWSMLQIIGMLFVILNIIFLIIIIVIKNRLTK